MLFKREDISSTSAINLQDNYYQGSDLVPKITVKYFELKNVCFKIFDN